MLFFALPRLPHVSASIEGVFTVTWLLFAMLIIGANFYSLIGADRETQARRRANAILQWKLHEMERRAHMETNRSKQENKRRFMS